MQEFREFLSVIVNLLVKVPHLSFAQALCSEEEIGKVVRATRINHGHLNKETRAMLWIHIEQSNRTIKILFDVGPAQQSSPDITVLTRGHTIGLALQLIACGYED